MIVCFRPKESVIPIIIIPTLAVSCISLAYLVIFIVYASPAARKLDFLMT